ncbi:MAG TPA: tetratricopeptide repeat protein [Candidatus Obscuribacterales bacterium]
MSPNPANPANQVWHERKVAAEAALQRGDLQAAESMWHAALEQAEYFNEGDPRLAFTLDNLADAMTMRGRAMLAEPLYRRSLAIKTKLLGPQHLSVAHTMNALAGALYSLGRHGQAETSCKMALLIFERELGKEHLNVGMTAGNLAMVYHSLGRHMEAQQLYRRALNIRTKILGHDHPDVAALRQSYSMLLARTSLTNLQQQKTTWTVPSMPSLNPDFSAEDYPTPDKALGPTHELLANKSIARPRTLNEIFKIKSLNPDR